MARSTPHLYPVRLSPEQRQRLEQIVRVGSAPVRKVRHAQVLLASDRNRPGGRQTRTQIADTLGMHVNTVDSIRKRFVLEGEAPALHRRPRLKPPTPPILDGHGEAHLVALCCSPAPEGRTHWTMHLLAEELKARRIVTQISAETVRKVLKKTSCSPGASNAGASRSGTRPGSWPRWKKSWTSTRRPPIPMCR